MKTVIKFENAHFLDQMENIPWNDNEKKEVEYFPGKKVSVLLMNILDNDLEYHLKSLIDGNSIAVDFEWKPDNPGLSNPIALFQFCSSKGVLIIQNENGYLSQTIFDFMNNNALFGKGMHNDKKKLRQMFGTCFDIEDIQTSWLTPYNVSLSFNLMISELVGEPTASFKDKKISRSNWNQRPLSIKQVLYAGFDAYGLYLSYQSLVQRYHQPSDPSFAPKYIKIPKSKNISTTGLKDQKHKPSQRISRPRFDPDVPYRESNIFPLIVRNTPVFVPQPEYNSKLTLYNYLTRINIIDDHYCNECQSHYQDIIPHCWNNHYMHIPQLYFPIQSKSFLTRCLQEIALANDIVENKIDSYFSHCKICNKRFDSIHSGFTHCRLEHHHLNSQYGNPDIKELAYDCFRIQSLLNENPFFCQMCSLEFPTKNDLCNHIWDIHGQIIPEMWKHRPAHYSDSIYTEVEELGISALNDCIFGEIINGIIACWSCKIGFDSPSELFMHLFHKHSGVKALRASDIPDYPFRISSFPRELYLILQRLCQSNAEAELEIANIITKTSNGWKCLECDIEYQNHESWDHLAKNHLIVVFDPGKPVIVEE